MRKITKDDVLRLRKQATVDVSDLVSKYDTFDKGHDAVHMQQVADFAKMLAEKHAVKDLALVDLAARLHDIGIERGRDMHEQYGADMIMEDPRFDVLGVARKRILANAIRQHRASTGKPTSIIGKIVSDADRASSWVDGPKGPLLRAYNWGVKNMPELTEQQQRKRAVDHIIEKFSPSGTGRRLYFPETEETITSSIGKIDESLFD